MSQPALATLQAHDRGNHTLQQYRVTQWPITVGRSLQCDWTIDDPHLAAEHLRIDADAQGALQVQVLDTDNGIGLAGQRHARGQRFAWPAGQELTLGRLSISARLAGQALAPEQRLHQGLRAALRPAVLLTLALLALCLHQVITWWLQAGEGGSAGQVVASTAGLLMALAAWSLLWALVSKLFSRKLMFWQHLQIISVGLLALSGVSLLANLAAFSFSWESLARFEGYLTAAGAAAVLWWHLKLALPTSRQRLGLLVAAFALAGMAVKMGLDWQNTKRLSNTLYLSSLFPPGWRIASAVPSAQWLQESQSIKARLDERLADKQDSGTNEESDALD
jgi:FHA domain